ncbi:cytoplasmic protein [Brucella sp. BE17]|uniref:cytoplasmic protein n=1 Tax=Brucella sp. BE17 TaxID=3142977 RepID=UPI0031BA0474
MEAVLKEDRLAFLTLKSQQQTSAMQRVALQIIAGIDIDRMVAATVLEKKQTTQRLARLIERERQKGLNGHWSYDLNRHIALKQALDRIMEGSSTTTQAGLRCRTRQI